MLKKIIKYSLRGLLGIIVMLLLLLAFDPTDFQNKYTSPDIIEVPVYNIHGDVLHENVMLNLYGKNKVLPKGFELAALRALAHYPELHDVRITFKFSESDYEARSRPEPLSVLWPWRERRYQILISPKVPKELEKAKLEELPYNAQIGLLGHELAHTASYLDKSSLELVWIGIKYALSADFRKEFERATDARTIEHKLGYQLKAWSQIAHPLLEQVGRGQNYMTPEEITKAMK